ncbi:MAG: RNA polymerase subunit sigma-70 [Verrucomicrobia bacterium]|nr:RNA polymerase subunit sigma-70 [Verrucomicrobiota bacterium]
MPDPHRMIAAASEMLTATVRDSRSALLGYLASRSGGDLAAAEDALSDAVLAAIQQWPVQGIPEKPEAWLLQVARRRLLDEQRKQSVRERLAEPLRLAIETAIETASMTAETETAFPDERLKLLFVCAHPAIDEAARTPLMLQVVLGLEAHDIAPAFLVAPATMAQRLVRAKAKIKAAAIPFAVPEPSQLPERLEFVLDAIYAAFTQGNAQLITEAIHLGGLVVKLAPESAEALGLVSLMLHSHARHAARLDDAGRYVPLDEQDTLRWDHTMIERAEMLLRQAAGFGCPGRFQMEAAIQSAHAQRHFTQRMDWPLIATLYAALLTYTLAIGARIAHAIAVARSIGAEHGLTLLDQLDAAQVAQHQPFWAAKAHLLAEAGQEKPAIDAFEEAIGL